MVSTRRSRGSRGRGRGRSDGGNKERVSHQHYQRRRNKSEKDKSLVLCPSSQRSHHKDEFIRVLDDDDWETFVTPDNGGTRMIRMLRSSGNDYPTEQQGDMSNLAAEGMEDSRRNLGPIQTTLQLRDGHPSSSHGQPTIEISSSQSSEVAIRRCTSATQYVKWEPSPEGAGANWTPASVAADESMLRSLFAEGEGTAYQPLQAAVPIHTTQNMEASHKVTRTEKNVAIDDHCALTGNGEETAHQMHILRAPEELQESNFDPVEETSHRNAPTNGHVGDNDNESTSHYDYNKISEERVSNCFQKSCHNHQSAPEKSLGLPEIALCGNLATVGTILSSLPPEDVTTSRREAYVASNFMNNSVERPKYPLLGNTDQSTSLNLTEIADEMHKDDSSAEDSLRSATTMITVGGYRVKPKYVRILTSILSKYGDIGVNCSLVTVTLRSICMELVCNILRNLINTSFEVITERELEGMLSIVSDIELDKIEVGWLKERLNEICEAKKAVPLLSSSSSLKTRHADNESRVQRLKQQLEIYKKDLDAKQAEVLDLLNKVKAAQCDLSTAESDAMETGKVISDHRAKLIHVFELRSLVHGLLDV